MKSCRIVCAAAMTLIALTPAAVTKAQVAPFNLPEAIAAQQRLVEKNTTNASLYNDLGNLLYLGERLDEAEEAYQRGLKLDENMISLRYNLGLLLHQSERPRRAEREFRRVLKHDPSHAWSHYQLSVVLAERGRRSAAIKSLARSMRLDPRLTDPAFNPHIVENGLASSAILLAYSDLSPAALAPRVYENPDDVTRVLLAAQEGRKVPERKVGRRLKREERKRAREADSGN